MQRAGRLITEGIFTPVRNRIKPSPRLASLRYRLGRCLPARRRPRHAARPVSPVHTSGVEVRTPRHQAGATPQAPPPRENTAQVVGPELKHPSCRGIVKLSSSPTSRGEKVGNMPREAARIGSLIPGDRQIRAQSGEKFRGQNLT